MSAQSAIGRPRIPRLVAIGIVVVGVAVAGAPLGALWAWLVPPIHGVVALTRAGERVQAYLGGEGENLFVAPVLLLGLLTVLAATVTALVWQWTAHRGPGMLTGLSLGLIGAAGLAVLVGAALVRHRCGAVDIDAAPVTSDHRIYYYAEAPPALLSHLPLQIAATLLLPAAVAAMGYALCATWSIRDDLGGYPAVGGSAPGITVLGGAPHVR